jgi:hypothetical protein
MDMTKLIFASRNFASAPIKCSQGNVGDIFSPRNMFEEKFADLPTCAVRFRCKIKDVKNP